MTVPEATGVQWSIFDFIYKGKWWKSRRLVVLNIFLLIPLLTSIINGLDSSLINGLQLLPEWQRYFGTPRGKALGILNSAQFVGNLSGLPFTPFISDRFGRRAALFFGGIVMCVGVGIQAAAWSIPMFIGARFAIGFGLSFCQNASPLLLIELSYPTQRAQFTSMFNSCWYFGSIMSAWVVYGAFDHGNGTEWTWRVPTLVQAVCPLIQIIVIWFVPESPRWLVSKGRESLAAEILAKYHSQSGSDRDPLVMFEMAQMRHAIRLEEEVDQNTSYLSLFSSPGNRRRMRIILGLGVFSQWSGNGLVSYYINLVLEGVGIVKTEEKIIINGCLQIFNFVIAIMAALLVDVAGRRPLFLISNAGMLVTFSCWTITVALYHARLDVNAAKATIPLIFLFYFFYDLAYTPMLVAYALEILPFRVRARGFAVMNLTIMATIAFNQFVNPWALDAISWRYYLVYCGWLVFELVFIYFFIVETKRRTLEETAALFDGDENPRDLVAMGGEAANMSVRLSRGIILPGIKVSSHEDRKDEVYELQGRDRYSSLTASSADMHLRVI